MEEGTLIAPITCIIGFLLLAATSAIGMRRAKFPYTIGLVVVGLGVAMLADNFEVLQPIKQMHLTPDIILYILVPILVFEAAINIDSRALMRNLAPVLTLAAPGLVIATAITGTLVGFLTPLSFGAAMLFGALISATDPVAVIALFKELGAPKRVTLLVDGESLFNDATAIVLFDIIFGILAAGVWGAATIMKGAGNFVFVFLGGVLVGALIGRVMMWVISFAKNDPLIEVAFSTVVAFAAFLVANYYLKVSGVMSVVGAGIVVSWFGSTRFTPEVKQYIKQFWGYAAFLANSFIFLMLGLTEDLLVKDITHYRVLLLFVLGVVATVTLARAVVVFGLVPLVNKLPRARPINRRIQTVIFWGGLRGAVPLALALSLPHDFPHRRLILELTLGVVLFTLLVQGTTVSRLMRWLRIDEDTIADKAACLRALVAAKGEGLRQLSGLESQHVFPETLVRGIEDDYQKQSRAAQAALEKFRDDPRFPEHAGAQTFWTQAVAVEKQSYRAFFERGFFSDAALREIELEAERLSDTVRRGTIPPVVSAARPLGIRLKDRACEWITRVMPRSRFARRRDTGILVGRFEHDAALVEACFRVMSALDRLAELNGTRPDVVAQCREFYEERRADALQRLDCMAKQIPEYMNAVTEQVLRRAAMGAEYNAIEELATRGAIPDKIRLRLLQNIADALETMKPVRVLKSRRGDPDA